MKIAIIGAGFGGLAAGYRLAKSGLDVSIFEADEKPGGLAVGFQKPDWKWSLEKHYHHWFTNDHAILGLANEIVHEVKVVRPKTSTFIDGRTHQLDSPISLMLFDELSLVDRVRTGAVLAYLKTTSNWKSLEGITSEDFIKKYMGYASWKSLWEPLFDKKFGKYASGIPASWFWARIKKRTASLAYPVGGFLNFAENLSDYLGKNGVNVTYKTKAEKISKSKKGIILKTDKGSEEFERVICTLPTPLFAKITVGLPESYLKSLINLRGLGAVNLVLSLNKQFLQDGTYWLNINAKHFPFLAVVEHTNFMNKRFYNGESLIYVGNYLPQNHEYFKIDMTKLLHEFMPFLKTINPKFKSDWIESVHKFDAPFAQPIIPLNYSSRVPDFETPIEGLYLCNIQQVYPWDRGTNYAVELGYKVAEMMIGDL